jgi:LacI family transcriptional regulator
MNNTTLKKISQILEISISTVSRALKNHPDISEQTKLRVVELANAMDYEPNANAINLRTSNSRLFGLIVPGISNFFYDSFISSVEEESRKNNYALMVLQSGDDPLMEMTNLKLCRQNRVSGLFACLSTQTTNFDPFVKLREMNTPVIFFDKVPENSGFNKVCVADTASANMAATALARKNKKNILAIFGDERLLMTRKRLEAFNETTAKKNPDATVTLGFANNAREAEGITSTYLAKKVDAVFCMSDEILTGVMRAVQKQHLRIPEDVGVIAISNGFIPKLFYPEITYVETSGHKLGKLAFSSMMACLAGSTFIQELTIESILVEGGSL